MTIMKLPPSQKRSKTKPEPRELWSKDSTSTKSSHPKDSKGTSLVADLSLSHQRLTNISSDGMKTMYEIGAVKGVTSHASNKSFDCVGCILGKRHRTPIPKSCSSRATQVFQIVNSDVHSPFEVPCIGGARYHINFIDEYSNWTVIHSMRKKSDYLKRFKTKKAYAETHTNSVFLKAFYARIW